jgi:DNA-binding IclR family transcriptional regulator
MCTPVGDILFDAIEEAQRQRLAMLVYIRGYQMAHDGLAPTVREIAEGLQLGKTYVHGLLDQCVDLGWLERLPRRTRCLRVLLELQVPTAPDGAPLHFIPIAVKPVSHGEQHG